MPYAGNVYSVPPGTQATTLTPIDSSDYNAFVEDIEQAQNDARPIVAGGTGVDSVIKSSSVNTASPNRGLLRDMGGVNTVGGAGNVITLTAALAWTAYGTSDGQIGTGTRLTFIAGAANTGATTLNVNSIGAKAIRKIVAGNDIALVASDILVGRRCDLIYDAAANSAAGGWILVNPGNIDTGGQLKFPATQNASSDANTLDDYEEFTFQLSGAFATVGTSSWAYTTRDGVGTKVGDTVAISGAFSATPTIGTGSSAFRVTGIPFSCAAGMNVPLALVELNNNFTWPSSRTMVQAYAPSLQSYVQFVGMGSAQNPSFLTASNMTTGALHNVNFGGTVKVS